MVAGGRELLLASILCRRHKYLRNYSHVLKALRLKELCEVAQELNIFLVLQLGVIAQLFRFDCRRNKMFLNPILRLIAKKNDCLALNNLLKSKALNNRLLELSDPQGR